MLTEPKVNFIVDLLALSFTTVTVTDVDTATETAVDMGVSHNRDEILLVDYVLDDNVDDAFITIQESVDQNIWSNVAVFQASDGLHMRRMTRTGRYLRVVIRIEFVQPDAEVPVASTYMLSIKVVQ